MKEVMIILRPKMYFPTKDALDQAGFHSMTIREIIGRGKCPVHYDYDEGAPCLLYTSPSPRDTR